MTHAQKQEEKTDTGFKGSVAQLLGIRGGDKTTDIWKIRLQLCKPVTWIPLIWGMLLQPCAGAITWVRG